MSESSITTFTKPATALAFAITSLFYGTAWAGFPASTSLANLDGNNGTRIDGVAAGDFLGYAVSKAGDFNGDGHGDFIIGAPNSAVNPGSAYLIYGSANGLAFPVDPLTAIATNQGFRIDGAVANSQLGTAVADAGDINGDDIADVLVGAPGESAAYVLFGRTGGYSGSISVGSLDGSNGFRIAGLLNAQLGFSAANAGDVNGDGLNDIVVGNGGPNLGVGYVVFGSRNAFPASVDTGSLDGSNGFALADGPVNISSFLVNGAGDINADGVADLVIGSWYSNAAYVVFGKNSGFTASVSLYGLNGSNGFVLNNGTAGSSFGSAVAGVGDINGDGIADLAIGAPTASTTSTNNQAGKTYVLYGSGAGFTSPVNVGTFNGSNGGLQIYGAATRDRSGWSVAAAGDINDDGHADLAIGAPYSSYGASVAGTSYVVFGQAGNLPSPINLSGNVVMPNHLDGNNGFQLPGAIAASQSGWAVAGAGDLNADGADDLLIGARLTSSSAGLNAGSGYVFYGQASDTAAPVTSITANPAANVYGWNNAAVSLSTNAVDASGIQQTRCELDPVAAPATFDALPATACGNSTASTEGNHLFYAASIDTAGNRETPVSHSVNIDLTAPLVKVNGVKKGATYRKGKVPVTTCSSSDALSGIAAYAVLTVTGGNANGTGKFTATCSGALDRAGNSGSAAVSYTVK